MRGCFENPFVTDTSLDPRPLPLCTCADGREDVTLSSPAETDVLVPVFSQ